MSVTVVSRTLLLSLLLIGLSLPLSATLTGCSKSRDKSAAGDSKSGGAQPKKPLPGTLPISGSEATRGDMACKAWSERACRCAASAPQDAELAKQCRDAKNMPNTLRIAIEAANGKGMERLVRARLQREAQRIIARCFAEPNKLDPARCAAKPAP